ncbi:ABC transporter, solute-binding protein [Lachnoanaerobaculum saburreum F0468]|jgi:carbohydrate ABC transporter substrate-binding protein, CUT1 family (TC 3.A.1.1.-)|uniref:ABC transporter, solute-binding protein n=1 Tax=Lachnoanaerobaculum saburreum F0468 TaxID=1095750 RepID=I0R5M0_9FIRM|nr:extracellular solute-binding protein [Lachnoanaerobaculum saburreum]EIC94978.1 ABC transporter, solute-binding protein [Lachnoanaerobaculum saburreum F0468]
MIKKIYKKVFIFTVVATVIFTTTGCGELFFGYNRADTKQALDESYTFPLKEKETITGLISYPTASEPDPNKRAIFERLEQKTNVHVDWTAIPSDQWGDKIALQMVNYKTLQDFVFSGGFSDSNLLKYADQGVIIPLEDYIEKDMPNLKKVFEKYPEYKTMVTATDGHIYSLPWIEQLGEGKTAIQTVGGMSYINKKWLDFLKLEVPTDIESFENVLQQFKDHASEIQAEFNIEGSIIPMSCIVNNGDQDPAILINGFGEGYGDADKDRHIAVTEDKKVISAATQEGYKEGIKWLHKLYAKGLIDPECFTQEWSTYVSKGKSGRYGVCFTWDIANIDNLKDWVPLPALTADIRNITPQNGSFTSGFDRGRCVVTALAKHPALVCSWLDQMYAPIQSPQNNWGTYGEKDKFNIFVMSTNSKGEPMLKHAPLGDVSPVEVREAQSVGGPLAILNEYYNVYVTVPDDAQYRLDWIKDIYTPDMNTKYVYPNVFMSQKDTEEISNLLADIKAEINTKKSDWIMNGMSDEDWNEYIKKLDAYGLQRFLEIYQSYLDKYFEALGQ